MKNISLLIIVVILLSSNTSIIKSQTSDKATTTAGAVLIIPMTITQTSPLHFGTITLLNATPGTCVLSTANVRTFTGGLGVSSRVPLSTNASYTVTGKIAENYAITLPSTPITIKIGTSAVPADNMTITAFKARFLGGAADAITSKLSATGTDSFTVGGTLNSIVNQNAGIYAGTFDVSIDYN